MYGLLVTTGGFAPEEAIRIERILHMSSGVRAVARCGGPLLVRRSITVVPALAVLAAGGRALQVYMALAQPGSLSTAQAALRERVVGGLRPWPLRNGACHRPNRARRTASTAAAGPVTSKGAALGRPKR